MDTSVPQSTLALLGGYLAGMADQRFQTGTRWTMMFFEDMQKGKLDIQYLARLERSIARRWPKNETPPSISDVLGLVTRL